MIVKYVIKAPCEIITTQLGAPKEYRQKLIEEAYRLKDRKDRENEDLFKKIFNENEKPVIASGFGLWQESKMFNSLLDHILQAIIDYSPNDGVYRIKNTWLGIYNKDQIATKHHHQPAYKSFCYYINCKEPYTPMVFNDADLEIEAITDRLIIFPSHLQHSVPPSKGGERIMIAGNVVSS